MLYAQRVRRGGWDKVISPFSPDCFLKKKLESSSKFARGSSAGRQEIHIFALFGITLCIWAMIITVLLGRY